MKIKKYFIITLGILMVAFAISVFYTPNKIVSGGVSGISTILFHTMGIAPGISFGLINIVLLTLAYIFMGKKFVANTIFGAVLLSLFVQIFSYIKPITNDMLLATVFGAVLYGIGIGLTLIEGASTAGTDILSRLLQLVFPYIKIGTLLLVIDAVVIFLSFLIFKQIEYALYGIMALCVSSFAINWLIQKLNISKLAFVVTSKGMDIAKNLVSNSPRGVTIINAVGGYTNTDKNVLMCALKESETEKFQSRILKIDANAFIIFSESSQIVGNGFRVYK